MANLGRKLFEQIQVQVMVNKSDSILKLWWLKKGYMKLNIASE